MERTQPYPSIKIGLKIYWAWPCPNKTKPRYSHSPWKLPQASYPYLSKGRQNEIYNHRKLTNECITVKLWAMLCRATQDRCVMVESSAKTWLTGEGNVKPLQYSCLENPINSIKRQKDMTMKDELPRSIEAQDATGNEWENSSRKN